MTTGLEVLPPQRWREAETAHAARVDALTAGHRARARAGQSHPDTILNFEDWDGARWTARRDGDDWIVVRP